MGTLSLKVYFTEPESINVVKTIYHNVVWRMRRPRKANKVFYTYIICIVTLVGLVGSSAYVSAASASPVPNPIGREGAIPSAVSGSIEKIVTELVDVEGAAPDAVGGAAENLAPRFIERGPNFERWDLGGGRFAWNSAPQWVWDGSEWVPYIYENRWEDGYYQVQSGLIGARVYDYYAEFHTPDLSEIRVHDERWEVQRWVAKGRGRWDDVGAQSGTPVFSVLENGNDITVRKTFNSWAGELEINYIFREGLPLKRDVVWTSAIEENTTFRVLQRWAGIAGDKVRHGGGENRVAAALVIDSPFFEFGDDNGMTVLEEQHPMYYDENGERLTEHCLRPVAVDVHSRGLKADFAFENWALAPGESLVVDPYTSTLSNPTQDGHVYYYYRYGMSGYSRDSTGDVIKMYDIIVVPPYYIYYYYRGYVEWNVSSIPDGANILDTDFKYHGKSTGSGAHIHEMLGTRPSTSSDLAVYTEIGEGTTYADPAGFPEAGTNKQVDLGVDADLDLQDQLSSDWFAIGLMREGTSTTEIYSEDYASANPKPTLYVEYTGGYELLEGGVKIQNPPSTYVINPSNDDINEGLVVNEINSAFEEWDGEVSGVNIFVYGGLTNKGEDQDGENVISFASIDGTGGILAYTRYWYIAETEELVEYDIVFDLDDTFGVDPDGEGGETIDAFDLRNAATHEAGHSLVLRDLTESVYSEMTMYGDTVEGETKKRSLEWGDIEGIHYLYGY